MSFEKFILGLCTDSINQITRDMPPPTPADLQGFWEMVLLQVENVDTLYAELDKMRANGWKVHHSKQYLFFYTNQPIEVMKLINTNKFIDHLENNTSQAEAIASNKTNETTRDRSKIGYIVNSNHSIGIGNNEKVSNGNCRCTKT